jgi:hypothetical protein
MMTGARLIVVSRRLLPCVFTTLCSLPASYIDLDSAAGVKRLCSRQSMGIISPTNKCLGR